MQLGSLDVKRKIQQMVFPEGIIVDTTNQTYLTSKVNFQFHEKAQFIRSSEGEKEKLLTKKDEELSLVDKSIEISNLNLIRDMEIIIGFEEELSTVIE